MKWAILLPLAGLAVFAFSCVEAQLAHYYMGFGVDGGTFAFCMFNGFAVFGAVVSRFQP